MEEKESEFFPSLDLEKNPRKKKTTSPVLLQARKVGRLVALRVVRVGRDLGNADPDVFRVADPEVLGERVGARPEVGGPEVGRGLFFFLNYWRGRKKGGQFSSSAFCPRTSRDAPLSLSFL